MESKGIKNKLTCINPGGVFGDALDTKGGTSIEYVRQFLKGKFPATPKWGILISDVKDVAKSHVACLGNSKVGGRRLIIGKEVKTLLETSKILAEALPEYAKKLPKKTLPNFMVKFISMLINLTIKFGKVFLGSFFAYSGNASAKIFDVSSSVLTSLPIINLLPPTFEFPKQAT